MTLHILSLPGVKKTRFALGLDWRHFDARPSEKELRVMGSERGTWATVRQTVDGAWQAGFASPLAKTSRSGLIPLAALVAESRPQPWRAVFSLGDDLFWYIAVRDDHEIIPDGDVVGTFDEIVSVRSQHDFYGAWHEIEGSPDLEMLADIVAGYTAKKPVIRSVAQPSWLFPAIAGGLVLTAAAGGLVAWHLHQEAIQKAKIAALIRRQAMEAAMAHEKAKNIVLPWVAQPDPDLALAQCGALWSSQPLSVAGWTLASWSCQIQPRQVMASASFERAGGVAALAPGRLDASGDKAMQTASAPIGADAKGAGDILMTEDAQRAFWSLVQAEGFKAQLGAVPVIRTLPGEKSQPPEDPWVIQRAQITLPAPPWAMGLALDRAIPGFRVSSLAAGQQGWVLTGQLFSSRLRGPSPATAASVPSSAPSLTSPSTQP